MNRRDFCKAAAVLMSCPALPSERNLTVQILKDIGNERLAEYHMLIDDFDSAWRCLLEELVDLRGIKTDREVHIILDKHFDKTLEYHRNIHRLCQVGFIRIAGRFEWEEQRLRFQEKIYNPPSTKRKPTDL